MAVSAVPGAVAPRDEVVMAREELKCVFEVKMVHVAKCVARDDVSKHDLYPHPPVKRQRLLVTSQLA